MIIVTRAGTPAAEIAAIEDRIRNEGLKSHQIEGANLVIIGVIGDPPEDFRDQMKVFPGVERVVRISAPYKLAGAGEGRPPTEIRVGDVTIGGGGTVVIAGPCTIESREQLLTTAEKIKQAGATILRGGAYKPRTSPYSFQGLEVEGLKYLKEVSLATGLATITEVMEPELVATVAEYTDILQIGARNTQNFPLLKAAGKSGIPVMVKRGPASTISEWLMSAEYVMAEGNPDVILCERGIRSFDDSTRNTQDVAAVAVAKRLSHLPVIIDPSHGTGVWHLVQPLALAGIAAGADGVMVEVHPAPELALADGAQSLTFENFDHMMTAVRRIAGAMDRPLRQLQTA
jgi:3-deoxy-7-phosphoheptulonate synthase